VDVQTKNNTNYKVFLKRRWSKFQKIKKSKRRRILKKKPVTVNRNIIRSLEKINIMLNSKINLGKFIKEFIPHRRLKKHHPPNQTKQNKTDKN